MFDNFHVLCTLVSPQSRHLKHHLYSLSHKDDTNPINLNLHIQKMNTEHNHRKISNHFADNKSLALHITTIAPFKLCKMFGENIRIFFRYISSLIVLSNIPKTSKFFQYL